MSANSFSMMQEQFENSQTGEMVTGVTIIIDGKLKQCMDVLMEQDPAYKDYSGVVRAAFLRGLRAILDD